MTHAAHDVLTPTQTHLIWALLAKQGYAAQHDLGVVIDPSERDELEAQRLISLMTREQNTIWLKLEDTGWVWAEAHLTKALPPSQLVLHNMMVCIDAHLKSTSGSLVDLIGRSPKAGLMDPELTGVIDA